MVENEFSAFTVDYCRMHRLLTRGFEPANTAEERLAVLVCGVPLGRRHASSANPNGPTKCPRVRCLSLSLSSSEELRAHYPSQAILSLSLVLGRRISDFEKSFTQHQDTMNTAVVEDRDLRDLPESLSESFKEAFDLFDRNNAGAQRKEKRQAELITVP